MTHKQWFSDAVASAQIPIDPAATARRRMFEISTLLTDMEKAFNEVCEEMALEIHFLAMKAPHHEIPGAVVSVVLRVYSPHAGPDPLRSYVDVPRDPKDANDIGRGDVKLAGFWLDGSDICCESPNGSPRELLGDADVGALVKAAVENFLRAEKIRRDSHREGAVP
jgi:hypothetical protein